MLSKSSLQFLKDLRKNNHRDWFLEHKKQYESAKSEFAVFVDQLIESLAEFDPSVAHLTHKDCTFRINRDVRFSKDKSPYKTNFGASINPGGKKAMLAGYYFHFEPGASFIGGGLYMPPAPELKKVRQEIDYNLSAFQKIVSSASFKKQYGQLQDGKEYSLSSAPRGYDAQNPALPFLKLKSFVAFRSITDQELQEKTLLKTATSACKALTPLLHFLNVPLLDPES